MDREKELRLAIAEALESVDSIRTSLDLVGDISMLETITEDLAAARVSAARADGASWSDIAEKLGVSRQAAHKRYGAIGRLKRKSGIELEVRLGRSDPS